MKILLKQGELYCFPYEIPIIVNDGDILCLKEKDFFMVLRDHELYKPQDMALKVLFQGKLVRIYLTDKDVDLVQEVKNNE